MAREREREKKIGGDRGAKEIERGARERESRKKSLEEMERGTKRESKRNTDRGR